MFNKIINLNKFTLYKFSTTSYLKNSLPIETTASSNLNETKIRKPQKRKTENEKSEISVGKDIREYFKEINESHVLDKIPIKLLRKKIKTPDHYYLFNKSTASIISKYLLKDLNFDRTQLIEINPGLGYLTKELLNCNKLQDLVLFEFYDKFIVELNNLNNNKIKLNKGDFIRLYKLIYLDKIDNGDRVKTLLNDLTKSNWDDDPNIRIFATVGSDEFFKDLIMTSAFQTGLFSYGRPEFFMVVPPPLYIHLTCSNKTSYLFYRSTTILFQIMFEHEFLTKIPREHFFPRQYNTSATRHIKLREIRTIDPEFMYLVKITPRKNLFDFCSAENLPALWYFVKQNCVSRKNRIIPTLERWIPGCGPRLIVNFEKHASPKPLNPNANLDDIPLHTTLCEELTTKNFYNNLNIFTEFGDLTPSQMLTLFNTFYHWKEYPESSFRASMESSLMKFESVIVERQGGTGVLDIPDDEDEKFQLKK